MARTALLFLIRHPVGVITAAVTGSDIAVRVTTALCLWIAWSMAARLPAKIGLSALLVLTAFTAQSSMRPIALALRMPLDEGMVMDMPITVPRISVTQALDDLKARNMVLCRFPEVQMVMGNAGSAETPFDPAPLDMIETMVEFRPRGWWPRLCWAES